MENTNHTPGPWILGDENNQCCEVVLGCSHNLVVSLDRQDINTGKVVIERDEMLANARLIAAAPDLLAALQELYDIPDDDLLDAFDEWQAAKAAIRKAIS
jgi:hypothetical protein